MTWSTKTRALLVAACAACLACAAGQVELPEPKAPLLLDRSCDPPSLPQPPPPPTHSCPSGCPASTVGLLVSPAGVVIDKWFAGPPCGNLADYSLPIGTQRHPPLQCGGMVVPRIIFDSCAGPHANEEDELTPREVPVPLPTAGPL